MAHPDLAQFLVKGSEWFLNPATANHDVFVIAHDGLPGSDRHLGGGEFDDEVSGFSGLHSRGNRRGVVSNLSPAGNPVLGRLNEPVGLISQESVRIEIFTIADHDLIGHRIPVDDIEGHSGRDTQSTSLSDGEVLMAFMLTDDFPFSGDDLSGLHAFRIRAFEEIRVVIVRNKADFLRIRLVEDGQIMGMGDFPDMRLRQIPDWQDHLFQSAGLGAEQHVALVLGFIHSATESSIRSLTLQSRIVAAGHMRGADLTSVVVKSSELQPVVASDAWVRCSSRVVLGLEVVDDATEILLEVEDVEGDIEHGSDGSGILGIVDGAAALMTDLDLRGVAGRVGPVQLFSGGAQSHEAAHHIPALFLEKDGGDGGIHSSGHGQQYLASFSRAVHGH